VVAQTRRPSVAVYFLISAYARVTAFQPSFAHANVEPTKAASSNNESLKKAALRAECPRTVRVPPSTVSELHGSFWREHMRASQIIQVLFNERFDIGCWTHPLHLLQELAGRMRDEAETLCTTRVVDGIMRAQQQHICAR
jgi:hypothetical protein